MVLIIKKLITRFWLIEFDLIIHHSIALLILYKKSFESNSTGPAVRPQKKLISGKMASAGIAMNSMNLNRSKIHCNRKFMVKFLLLSGTHEMTDDPLWGRLLRAKNHHFRRGMCVTGITVYVLGAQCLISTVKLWNFKKKIKIIF